MKKVILASVAVICLIGAGLVVLEPAKHAVTHPEWFAASNAPGLAKLPANARPNAAAIIRPQILENYGRLPMRFERNQGQTDQRVRYLSRGNGYTLFLTGNEAVLSVRTIARTSHRDVYGHFKATRGDDAVLDVRLIGANPNSDVAGLEELPGKSNYFLGNNPSHWRTDIPNYAEVEYKGIYPGVNLVYYGNRGRLENDFVVAAGANPKSIRLAIEGAKEMHLGSYGDLVLTTEKGELTLERPVAYQTSGTAKNEVAARYALNSRNQVGFELSAYDVSRPIVIDPVLSYSTYLGGAGSDEAFGIAVDGTGNAYVTGETTSPAFPGVTGGSFQPTNHGLATGLSNAFVTKINSTGGAVVYSTFLGGTGGDQGNGIAVDGSNQAYVIGTTGSSATFPLKNAFQAAYGGGTSDAFVTELNAAGNGLVYSSFLGGSLDEQGFGIAVDGSGNAFLTGNTGSSADFPIKPKPGTVQAVYGGGAHDAFVAEIAVNGASVTYAAFLGGSGDDQGNAIAVDGNGNAYITGTTTSVNFPVSPNPGTIQPGGFGGGTDDAFVAKIAAGGASVSYASYLGGTGNDFGLGIKVDGVNGNAYVTGETNSVSTFPHTASAFQSALAGGSHLDAFFTKVNTTGSALAYSTYYGGTLDDEAFGIGIDANGNAYIAGLTGSTNLPLSAAPFQKTFAGGVDDAFIARFDPTQSGPASLIYASYLGGNGSDEAFAIAVDTNGNAYMAGLTTSTNFPNNPGTIQAGLGAAPGPDDAFVAKVVSAPLVQLAPPANLTFATPQNVGSTSAAQPITLTNIGDATLNVASVAKAGDFGESDNCTPTVLAGKSCTINVTFTPTQGGARAGSVTITDNNLGAAGAQQTITLNGTGADFTISAAPGSQTVTRGTSALYTLTIAPVGGSTQTVAFACAGNPAKTNCSAPSVTLDGVHNATPTLTITTSKTSPSGPGTQSSLPPASPLTPGTRWFLLVLAGVLLSLWAILRRRGWRQVPATAFCVLLWLFCLGCTTTPTGTPTGTSTVTVTGTSGSDSHSTTVTLTVQ